ncbi:MAG TPA: effector binding domain-containing protein [Mucilaginibacter sp.]|jgi:predicted transcriptional regulator YdeE|nr:effector binding domain-containing protein [Mucilaginibacter sp.]
MTAIEPVLTAQDSFFVAGIAVRTTNQDGRARKDIGDLWVTFMSEDIQAKIQSKYSNDVYCVYTDYETDHMGWYTAVLGCRVTEAGHNGMFVALVPSGSYRQYSPEGDLPDFVGEAWMQIWEESEGRSYVADYDVYGPNGRVEIFVGVD